MHQQAGGEYLHGSIFLIQRPEEDGNRQVLHLTLRLTSVGLEEHKQEQAGCSRGHRRPEGFCRRVLGSSPYFVFLGQTPAVRLHPAVLLLDVGLDLLVLGPLLLPPGHHVVGGHSVGRTPKAQEQKTSDASTSLLRRPCARCPPPHTHTYRLLKVFWIVAPEVINGASSYTGNGITRFHLKKG